MRHLRLFLIALVPLAAVPASAERDILPHIKHVHIALSGGDREIPSTDDLFIRSGKTIRGWLVVEAEHQGRRVFYSAAPYIRHRKKRRKTASWPSKPFGTLKAQYFKIEPVIHSQGIYDNTGTMEHLWLPEERAQHPNRWHWCAIEYDETPVGRLRSVWSTPFDTRPTAAHKHKDFGTMRYAVRVDWRNTSYRSLGVEHRGKAGIRPGVATVHVRRDDSEVGYMTELMNVPYVYGSSSPTGRIKDHQTERAVGADCADLIVYGWRRAGKKMGYTWSQGLKSHTGLMAKVTELEGGRYRQQNDKPLRFGREVKVGDILLWGRHVAVIAEIDPAGYLTPDTMILHTVVESPRITRLRDIGFGFDEPPFEVRRAHWKRSKRVSGLVQR